jgi:hypothetical protein
MNAARINYSVEVLRTTTGGAVYAVRVNGTVRGLGATLARAIREAGVTAAQLG